MREGRLPEAKGLISCFHVQEIINAKIKKKNKVKENGTK